MKFFMHIIMFRAVAASGTFRFWLALLFAAVMLCLANGAHAQSCTPITGSTTVSGDNYGSSQAYHIQLGDFAPGTCGDVTYVINNNTAYPLRFMLNSTTSDITLTASLVLADGYTIPADITVQPGQSFTVTFEVSLPATASAITNAVGTLNYSVGRVYDQVWRDDDFDGICAPLPASSTVLASKPLIYDDVGSLQSLTGITPGCVYPSQVATFVNDLSYPITVSYVGYSDSGTIAPYISGTLCDSDLTNCGNEWTDSITLQPGQSSDPFTMVVGSPWFIGNESQNTVGTLAFEWRVTPLAGALTQTPTSAPTPVPSLSDLALALLALGMAGFGTWRIRRQHRQP